MEGGEGGERPARSGRVAVATSIQYSGRQGRGAPVGDADVDVRAQLMVLGDLNANLNSPRGRQEDVLAAEASKNDLVCASK